MARLVGFLDELKAHYASYPRTSVLPPPITIVPRYVDAADAEEAADVFYGGFYLGTDFAPRDQARVRAEEALILLLGRQAPFASGLLDSLCGSRGEDVEPWPSIIRTACVLGGRTLPAGVSES